jgi:hypothetical protein
MFAARRYGIRGRGCDQLQESTPTALVICRTLPLLATAQKIIARAGPGRGENRESPPARMVPRHRSNRQGRNAMASAPEPVESGQSYTITHVDGREPESLDDFTATST